MDKVIIENRTKMPMITIMKFVQQVMDYGRISQTSKGDQFCFVTSFKEDGVIVYADKNKKSDKFIVTSE